MRHEACNRLLSILLLTAQAIITGPAVAADNEMPPVLDVRFDKGFTPNVGPAPVLSGENKAKFKTDSSSSFVSLSGNSEAIPIATWKAGGVMPTAQGTVSFRVRIPNEVPLINKKDPSSRGKMLPIMAMTNSTGGSWILKVGDQKYAPPEKEAPREPSMDLTAKKPNDGFAMDTDSLSLEGDPEARFCCEVEVKPLAGSQAKTTVAANIETMKRQEWHQVVWTWYSVNHTVYIDGKPFYSMQAISRMQPGSSSNAVLQLLAQNIDLADLRVYPRSVTSNDVARLGDMKNNSPIAVPPLRLWVDWALTTGRTVVFADVAGLSPASVELTCLEVKTGKTLKQATLNRFPSGLGEMMVQVLEQSHFTPGVYRFEGVAKDKDGKELAKANSEDWTAEKRNLIWLGSRAGLDKKTKIIPPYTPIAVKDGVISTSMRAHALDRTGLFKSIDAAGGELLESPVTLAVTAGGKALVFSEGAGLGKIENREDEAEWSAETRTQEGHSLKVAGYMEYDGLTRFDVTLTPNGKLSMEKAELLVPYRPEVSRVLHTKQGEWWHFLEIAKNEAGGYEAKPINWNIGRPKDRLPRRPGVIYDATDIGGEPEMEYPFAPFVHVGNFHRGVVWFVDNDRNWIHDPGRVPPMELVCTGKEQFLRLNVVARPTELTAPWTVRFYLLANPYKPLPKDWRTWVVAQNQQIDEVAKHSKHRFWFHWNEYADSFKPYPGLGDPDATVIPSDPRADGKHDLSTDMRYKDWIGKFKNDDLYHTPFINYGTPGGIDVWDKDTMTYPYTWKLHNNFAVNTYMVYWLERCVREIGIRGSYIDEPYCQPFSYNILAGDAPYVREDGTRGTGYRLQEGRDYFRRMKQMYADHGIDYSIWGHTTNYKPPFFTFLDISMDGEHPSIWVPMFYNYHEFYNPVMSRGYLAGQQYGYIGSLMFHGNTNPMPGKHDNAYAKIFFKCRTYLACTLAYGVMPQGTTFEHEARRLQNIRYALGVFDDGVDDLTMDEENLWMPGSKFVPKGLRYTGERNLGRNRALLYTSNTDTKQFRYELEGGFKGLALGKPHPHAWNAENGASLMVDSRTILETRPLDFAAILVEGRDTPQKTRPDGALLGLSFDNGIEPDFGGGMAPVVVASNCPAPAFVAGKAGKALQTGSLSYPIVPSWFAGTIEFDMQAGQFPAKPVRILALNHYLDVELSCLKKNDRAGFLLATTEMNANPRFAYDSKAAFDKKENSMDRREIFIPVENEPGKGWNHVTLTWRSGQYDLYWNGTRAGRLSEPVSPRLRDDASMARGVTVGSDGGLAVDSVLVYDWAFTSDDVAAGKSRQPMAVLPRPAPRESFPVWVWAKGTENCIFGFNLAGSAYLPKVDTAKFTLYDKQNSKVALGAVEIFPWLGTGTGFGMIKPNTKTISTEISLNDDIAGNDLLSEVGMAEKTVKVDLMSGTNTVMTRTFDLKTGSNGLETEY